jgi:long-subunit acyl-CoA synthetase (AMP-forming)
MPKGVALTHRNMISNSRQSIRFESKGLSWDSDAQLIMLPFYHIYVRSSLIQHPFSSHN